jgi:hypothetical protein
MKKKTQTGLTVLNIGFGNVVSLSRIIAVVTPGSSPMKRMREEAEERGKLIDATQGRKTRAITRGFYQVETRQGRRYKTHFELPGEGKLFIVSAPSGAGKTTLCRKLTSIVPRLKHSVSYTTRPRRKGEKNNVDYTFISEKKFKAMINRGEFVEWAVVHGNLYGTI